MIWLRYSKMGRVSFSKEPAATVNFRIAQGGEFGIDVRRATAAEIQQQEEIESVNDAVLDKTLHALQRD